VVVKAVIFDLFGTLIDNFDKVGYRDNLQQMARIMQVDEKKFIELWQGIYEQRVLGFYRSPEESIEIICKRLKVNPTPNQVKEASRIRWEFVKQALVPRPGTINTLKRLKESGLKIALLSDCSTEIPEIWPDTAFRDLFDTTTFSCNEAAKKPMPKIYILTADRLQEDVEECMFVGDGGSLELTGAARIGMLPIRIRTQQESTGTAWQIDPDPWIGTTISTVKELIPILKHQQNVAKEHFLNC